MDSWANRVRTRLYTTSRRRCDCDWSGPKYNTKEDWEPRVVIVFEDGKSEGNPRGI